MNRAAVQIPVLMVLASAMFFTSLGKVKLWDRDEPRNAGCALEMMERGDLVVPTFNDELRQQKPVMLYWLIISAYSVFGTNEFAARFWSAAMGVGTVLMTWGMARRLFGGAVALMAGTILSSSLMLAVAARAATPDSALIFFSTLGLLIYVLGTFKPQTSQQAETAGNWFPAKTFAVIGMYGAFALGVLTKGPVGVILPGAIIGLFLLIKTMPETEPSDAGVVSRTASWLFRVFNPVHFFRTCLAMRPITAIVTVLLIAGPWYLLVAIRTQGDFPRLFFLQENLMRATTSLEDHGGSWWYYPAAIAVGFFPWSVFLGPMVFAIDSQLSRKTRFSNAVLFLVCWIGVQVGLFSLAETKLPSYVTPCYPALAILMSYTLADWLPSQIRSRRSWMYAGYGTLVLAGLIILIGLAVATGKYFSEIWWVSLLGLVPIVGGALAILVLRFSATDRSIPVASVTAVLFSLLFFSVGTVAVDSARRTETLLSQIRNAEPDRMVATYRCLESSWVYYSGRPIFELQPGSSQPRDSQSLTRDRWWDRKPVVSPEEFVALQPRAMLITTDDHLDELMERLPNGFQITARADYFLKSGHQLVLVERTTDESPAVAESSVAESPENSGPISNGPVAERGPELPLR